MQGGLVAAIDVHDCKVQPVGAFVIGMGRGEREVNLILSVATILSVWSDTAGRHDTIHQLVGAPVELTVAILIGHGKAGNGGMPVDATPTQVPVCGVVAHDEGAGIGRFVGGGQTFLLTQ